MCCVVAVAVDLRFTMRFTWPGSSLNFFPVEREKASKQVSKSLPWPKEGYQEGKKLKEPRRQRSPPDPSGGFCQRSNIINDVHIFEAVVCHS